MHTRTKGTILVVDDDEAVRLALEASLLDAGFAVVTAESGEEAVDEVKRNRLDLALIDLVMPQMNGVETCRAIRRLDPGIKIIMISGYASQIEERLAEFVEAGGLKIHLDKPFRENEIVRTAEEILCPKKKSL